MSDPTQIEPALPSAESNVTTLQQNLVKPQMDPSEEKSTKDREETIKEEEKEVARNFPNPLENLFTPDLDEVDEEIPLKIPLRVLEDKDEEQKVLRTIRYNAIRAKRMFLYASIARMKTHMFKLHRRNKPEDWDALLVKAKEGRDQLLLMTEELYNLGAENPPTELSNVAKYLNTIKGQISKIENVVSSRSVDLEGYTDSIIRDYVEEEQEFREGKLFNNQAVKHLVDKCNQLEVQIKTISTSKDSDKSAPDYQGIENLKIYKFSGKESEFNRFKISFKAAFESHRNFSQEYLALQLEMNLTDRPLELVQKYLSSGIDPLSYTNMWEILEERYGGESVTDAYIIAEFKNAPPLKDSSFKEIERIYDIFRIQAAYYQKWDPESLLGERNFLMQHAKEKLNSNMARKFIRYTSEKGKPSSFQSLLEWIQKEFLTQQRVEREYSRSRPSTHHASNLRDYNQGERTEEDSCSGISVSTEENSLVRYRHMGRMRETGRASPFRNLSTRRAESNRHESEFRRGTCLCCKQAHDLTNCQRFKDISLSQRCRILKRNNICYHCLLGDHLMPDCMTDRGAECGVEGCKLYHHKLLHRYVI